MTVMKRLLLCVALSFELTSISFHEKNRCGVNGFLQINPVGPRSYKLRKDSGGGGFGSSVVLFVTGSSTSPPNGTSIDSLLDDLEPPLINFGRGSILFGEKPQTKRNNSLLTLWKTTRNNLPKFVTGAWREDTGDDNPLGALYNMAFVRLPIILAFTGYVKNNMDGHPLYVDFGNGPFEFIPIAAAALLILMMGPGFIIENENVET
uniref:Uncharacterized protein n=1 Tax=Eucampia antarctica TaxID=49252 RepID=A0A7S2SB67_9STRA|mmetsp:Transcript_5777/g.5395  ORF Transcript_5777/g.5395 Transcript_5777/m.5395 type:complete len:206 (+) Transcript_5777:28-645(+)|eukprot:CAMPEP_0197825514 /NCGR_PEP_ID=MMETSP1437-20131217/2577_1 /TAXON_ID=49252 ORGANISM="Eucampia antarctica, Strain CCMP1452" /NCGR_SAMPLE_ID=MMETSP1437 /ASSEMBLY_ACC=CAM_ASM_001096 /LENGTH=205 /DNA_ID=CAMNT_0043425531 /DNA_START=28 /DNA_END=645 /DNA_ORIENTATION=-